MVGSTMANAETQRFRATISPNAHTHVLRITDAAQLDGQVAAWTKGAYGVGCVRPLVGSGDS
jgi:hypothetical protein